MFFRTLQCLSYALLLRISWSEESSRYSRHRLKVHSPDEMVELAADGTISDQRFADDRPVMRREHAKVSQAMQEASLAYREDSPLDLIDARVARQAKSIGFSDDLLEVLLHSSDKEHSETSNILQNGDFNESSGWNTDCPTPNYQGHADIGGTGCSTFGLWNAAAHFGGNTSGNVWSIKALSDCYQNTRGAVYQDVRTTTNTKYQLDFFAIDAYITRKLLSNETSQLHIEVQSPPGSRIIDESINLTGSAVDPVEGSWSFVGPFIFKSQDENTRIYFYAGGSACPMLDNVGLRAVPLEGSFEPMENAEPPTTTTTSTSSTTTSSTTTTSTTTSSTSQETTSQSSTSSSTVAGSSLAPDEPMSTVSSEGPLDTALLAGAAAAAAAQAEGASPHQQALAAAHAAAAASKSEGRSVLQQALVAAKAAAAAIQSVGLPRGTLELQCAEAGRASFFVTKYGGMAQEKWAQVAGDAAVGSVKSQNLASQQMVECIAVAVKTACRSSGLTNDQQAECGGSAAIAAAARAGLSEDEQAEAAGKAVEAVMSMKNETSHDAWEELGDLNPENPRLQELLKAVQEARAAASEAAQAAAKAKEEMEATTPTTTTKPVPEVRPTEIPSTTTTMRDKHACPDNTRAPRGAWVVYNLSTTPILHGCLAKTLKQKVPDECCRAPGTVNLVGATFEELYFTNDYGSCVTLTNAGPLAGATANLQCNSDNTVTYAENCDKDCSCKFHHSYSPGCYRASDPLPGTAWFIVVAGCDCTDQKAVVPHQFSLPPFQQNVGAVDILNVGPEEAAKALNRQRQQLRAYYEEMVKDDRVMKEVVNHLSSGKPIADAIFGMDTGEIPEKVTKKILDAATKDPSAARYAVNATVSIMAHALARLKSGKPLADAVFGGDTSHLIQPHLPIPTEEGAPGNLPLPKSSFKGKFPNLKDEEPVERIRFLGDFEAIIGSNAAQFLEECSVKLKPVQCRDVQPGSVVVTLEAVSWADLETANERLSKEGLELPSFGTLEKEKEKEKAKDWSVKDIEEMSAEEKKKDLLNPDITQKDVQIVQSIFDKVHEEEEKEEAQGKEVEKGARTIPTTEERSASNLMVGVGMLVFGFLGISLCIYSMCKASGRVKQKITSVASKRLMKRAQVGDTQLVVTGIEDLQVGDEVLLGKERTKIQEIAISVTLSEGLAAACKSGDAVVPADSEASGGSLSKDAAEGDKELLVLKMPQIKKGDTLKVGSTKVTVKSVSKLLMVSPALTAAHITGTKIKTAGDPGEDTEPASPTSPTSPTSPSPAEAEPEAAAAAAAAPAAEPAAAPGETAAPAADAS